MLCVAINELKLDLNVPGRWLNMKKQFDLIQIWLLLAAWPRGQRRCFYDDPDLVTMGLTHTLAAMLPPWIRCFAMIICVWWFQTSSKFTLEEVKH